MIKYENFRHVLQLNNSGQLSSILLNPICLCVMYIYPLCTSVIRTKLSSYLEKKEYIEYSNIPIFFRNYQQGFVRFEKNIRLNENTIQANFVGTLSANTN